MSDISFLLADVIINIRVGAIIKKSDYLLLCRIPKYQWYSSPGGRTKTNESSSEALERELNRYSHYSLVATVEAIFNLGTLGRNDTSATPMSDLFRGGIP